MRRRGDDWINATHILKAAGFDKPARTRILEREVQKETHEKVQGGYGKYQGKNSPNAGRADSNCLKVLGFLSVKVKLWQNEIISTTNLELFSNTSQEISVPPPHPSTPQTNLKPPRSLRSRSGLIVSQQQL